ncbi:2-phospho-L-lactate transferase [Methanolobus chelungpuianus]|uniref:2-phospho-L-lactate transferase n=1 Tax=Methanolobus chelungpuianus TaxID=502115 RepID=A0AAE3KX13_9EURY|nr:2-phospho-L-lactate transferase [Methanolobus chelungpuianus]MCQ6962616.1 LPPG:FO 2-phospho-L-lactate transferase [Methanolobus chelungpuianus]
MLVLSGGTGTPKLLNGLRKVMPEEDITVIVNTAEDLWVSGNLVTPDIDTVLYLFSDMVDPDKWWGVKGDTFRTYELMKSLGHRERMMLGDLDRATHIMRTEYLREGHTLTDALRKLSASMGIRARVLPMSDDPVSTMIVTPRGKMHFQDFWIASRGEPEVLDVFQEGMEQASISPAVAEALENGDDVLIGPSNPITSIGPIIGLPGMADILRKKNVVAVSPIIGNEPVSGPAGKLMRAKGLPVSSLGVAAYYRDFLDVMVIDQRDPVDDAMFADIGCRVVRTDTLMKTREVSMELSRQLIHLFKA